MSDATAFVAAYDGQDRAVINAAVRRVRAEGARLHVIYVLEWSPYRFLTTEELAERHKVREAELSRAKTVVLDPLLAELKAAGIVVSGDARHGQPIDVICDVAREQAAELIFVGRSSSLSTRVFGSVASGLSQVSPVPVVIVP